MNKKNPDCEKIFELLEGKMPRRMNEPMILEIDDYLNKFGYVRKSIFSRATIWVNVLYVAKWLA